VDLGTPPLETQNLTESTRRKNRFLTCGLAVPGCPAAWLPAMNAKLPSPAEPYGRETFLIIRLAASLRSPEGRAFYDGEFDGMNQAQAPRTKTGRLMSCFLCLIRICPVVKGPYLYSSNRHPSNERVVDGRGLFIFGGSENISGNAKE